MTELSMIKHEETPTVFAYERHFTFDSGTLLRENVESFLTKLALNLKDEGCTVIGHIKGLIETDKGDSLFFNLTSFEQEPSFRGMLPHNTVNCRIALNVIVYGVSRDQVKRAVFESTLGFLPAD